MIKEFKDEENTWFPLFAWTKDEKIKKDFY